MKLDVVTPEGSKIRDLDVRAITLPGALGEMGILPGHEAMMASLGIGPMLLELPTGAPQTYALASGFVEVLADRVRILAECCERADEIDVERATAKRAEAEARLADVPPIETEAHNVVAASLRKAETRIAVAARRG